MSFIRPKFKNRSVKVRVRKRVWVRQKSSYYIRWKSINGPYMGSNPKFCVCVGEGDIILILAGLPKDELSPPL